MLAFSLDYMIDGTSFVLTAMGIASRARFELGSERVVSTQPLVLSDYVFLAGAVWSALLCLDPLRLNADPNSAVKHLIIGLTLLGLALTLAGNQIERFGERAWARWPEVLHVALPLIPVCAVIVTRSLYSRAVLGTEHTFLNVGLYMSLVFWTALMVCASRGSFALVRAYFWIWGAFSVAMGLVMIWLFVFSRDAEHERAFNYHELEYVSIPLAVFFAVGTANMKPTTRAVGFVFFISLAVFFKKNTGYLVGLITLAYLALLVWLPRVAQFEFRKRVLLIYLALLGSALLAALIAVVWAFREQLLPTGNPEFRAYTYAKAWALFLESPLWGNLWVKPAVAKFTLFETGMANEMLPTHSDLLDILANGGIIGMTLFVWGCARIARFAYTRVLSPKLTPTQWTPYAHALACSCLSAIPVIAFNPVLLRPSRTTFLWIGLGMLLAIALTNSPRTKSGRNPQT